MTENTSLIRLDSAALLSTFGAIANLKTGLGTSRSKSEWNRVNSRIGLLDQRELEALPYKDEVLRKAVHLYPESAVSAWFDLSVANNKAGDNLPDLMMKYIETLGDRQDKTEEEEGSELYGAKEAFLIASILARQFGKAYVLVGIDDGREFSEPIDREKIKSIRWLQVYDCTELLPEPSLHPRRSPLYYRFNWGGMGSDTGNYGRVVHKSRLLEFYGLRLFSRSSTTARGLWGVDGLSVLQGMFDAYSDWIQGIKAGAAMLADYDVFTLGMKGLAQLVASDRRNNSTAGQEAVMARALALDEGKSVVRGLLYDLENEHPGSVTRQYGGARDIMQSLEDRWCATASMPKFKLFGDIGGQGLASGNTAGLASRSEWAILVQDWSANNLLPAMQRLLSLAWVAKDSPSKGKTPDSYQVSVPFNLPLTDSERMDLENAAAKRSQVLVSINAVSPQEVRAGYYGSKFNPDIVLEPGSPAPTPPSPPTEAPSNPTVTPPNPNKNTSPGNPEEASTVSNSNSNG